MSFVDLPSEILILGLIVQTALDGAVSPSNILRVCQSFHGVGTECLYIHLGFTAPK
ncbi:hypothetical protein BS17DRAFT_778920 [Gyrodon lividus]|nr:hypothetical protein BS17DRAFT_778920 [Gyrodon lividus]